MAKMDLDEEEIVRVLALYQQDDGMTLGETYGPEAVTAVEDMCALIRDRLNRDEQNLSLWRQFEDEPNTTSVELAGWLEAFDEADPGFATQLLGLYHEFAESSRRTHPIRSATDRADDVVEDDVNNDVETPVQIQDDSNEYPEKATYLYGDIEGNDEYTPGNMGLNDQGQETNATLDALEDPDLVEVEVEADGMPGLFQNLFQAVREHPTLTPKQKKTVDNLLSQMQVEVDRGQQADENLLIHDLRLIRRVAPDIVDIMLPGMEGFAEEVRGPLRRAVRQLERQEEQVEGNE